MKTWQEALEILLKEIDLSVDDLARMTANSPSTIFKFLNGASNSRTGSLMEWLEGCERHQEGSIRMFHLICIDETPYKKKKTVKEHVATMDNIQMADYLSAISNRLKEDRENLLKQVEKKSTNLKR